MRTYPLICPCGWSGEMVAPAAERDNLRCPVCRADKRLETDYDKLRVGSDIEYNHGRGAESMMEGCHPSEVAAYRKACPHLNVTAGGRFIYQNRTHHRQCLRELQSFRSQARQRHADGGGS